jgi:hypothetical protein
LLKRAEGNEGHAETPPQVEPGHAPVAKVRQRLAAAASRSLLRRANASRDIDAGDRAPGLCQRQRIRPVPQSKCNTRPPVTCARRS